VGTSPNSVARNETVVFSEIYKERGRRKMTVRKRERNRKKDIYQRED